MKCIPILKTLHATFGFLVISNISIAQFNELPLPPTADDFKAYIKFNPSHANVYLTLPEEPEQQIGTIEFSGGLPVKKEITRPYWETKMSTEEFWVWNEFGKLESTSVTTWEPGVEMSTNQFGTYWQYENGLPSKAIHSGNEIEVHSVQVFDVKNGRCQTINVFKQEDDIFPEETGTITYDAKGRISKIVYTTFDFEALEENTTYSTVYTYNAQGALIQQTSYMGKVEDDFIRDTVKYEYNAQGMLVKIKIDHNMAPISEVLRLEYVK